MRYKAVFFDAGNTLLQPYPSVEHVCAEVFKRNGYEVSDEQISQAVALGDRYYEERYWQDDSFWSNEAEAEALWIELYSLVAGEVGINGGRRRIAKEIYDEFGCHCRWQLFPDVKETLDELKAQNLKVGIISNWDSRLADLCFGIGITPYLDFVMSSAVVGKMKPQPDIFELALRRAGVKAPEAIHVGDHYYADILGARSVGITPVLIHRAQNSLKADCVTIDDLRSLLGIIG